MPRGQPEYYVKLICTYAEYARSCRDICGRRKGGLARNAWQKFRNAKHIWVDFNWISHCALIIKLKQLKNCTAFKAKISSDRTTSTFPLRGLDKDREVESDVTSDADEIIDIYRVIEIKTKRNNETSNVALKLSMSKTELPNVLRWQMMGDFFNLFTKFCRIDLKFVYLIVQQFKL